MSPFKSMSQKRYLFAKKPSVAKKLSEHNGPNPNMPKYGKAMKKKMKEMMK